MRRALALATALVLAPVAALASDAGPTVVDPPPIDAPVASAVVADRQITLGRSFILFVRVVHAPGIEVNLPANLGLGDGFDEVRRTSEARANPDGSTTREVEVELIGFSLGQHALGPISVTFTARGEMGQVRTNPLVVEVVGVIGDGDESLRDVSPPVDIRRRDDQLLYVGGGILGALLLLLLLLLGLRLRGRRHARIQARSIARPRDAADDALARLARLESSGGLDADDLKPAYLTMSEIIKSYMAKRFGFPALELTTLEIRNELAARPDGVAAEEMIRSWLESADLVKFANQEASTEDASTSIGDARSFIDQTRRDRSPDAKGEEDADA